jgi:hypothetical protein
MSFRALMIKSAPSNQPRGESGGGVLGGVGALGV